jgi:hypothetical protein
VKAHRAVGVLFTRAVLTGHQAGNAGSWPGVR